MDELLQHCLHELAFDGDLGCDISRLRDFVGEFYTSHVAIHQTLDDQYHAFLWSIIVQYPSIRVGSIPDRQTLSDVYIPPQPRAGKKDKAAGNNGQSDAVIAVRLELIPDAKTFPLNELEVKYGNRLRIAVDPETCFVAITGSHAKPAKLTPMVYATLQLIARSREAGVSVLEIGKTTGYDQKTCFYLVKQLVDLDFVVKLRRGGNSQNFCVHKYFFDRSPSWNQIHEEELRGLEAITCGGDEEAAEDDGQTLEALHFNPIDTRHLTNLNIIRQRLIKLLKISANQTHQYTNIAVRIGFRPRSRTDRRFFIARLKELISEGTIEKIFVPSKNIETTQNKTLCLRLVAPKARGDETAGGMSEALDDDEKEEELVATDDFDGDTTRLRANVTLHKQIIDLMEQAGMTGITLNEISDSLGSFDKRTIELLVSRMERQPPPTNLADLSIVQVLETHGRERRYRYFTLAGYSALMTREGFSEPSGAYTSGDLQKAKGFLEVHEVDFYKTHSDLLEAFGKYRVASTKIGRARKIKTLAKDGEKPAEKEKKKKEWKNPLLPDGTRKRGRPIKDPIIAEKRRQKRVKKAEDRATMNGTGSDMRGDDKGGKVPRKATGILKRKRAEGDHSETEAEANEVELIPASDTGIPSVTGASVSGTIRGPAKAKRGRPPKKQKADDDGKAPQVPAPPPARTEARVDGRVEAPRKNQKANDTGETSLVFLSLAQVGGSSNGNASTGALELSEALAKRTRKPSKRKLEGADSTKGTPRRARIAANLEVVLENSTSKNSANLTLPSETFSTHTAYSRSQPRRHSPLATTSPPQFEESTTPRVFDRSFVSEIVPIVYKLAESSQDGGSATPVGQSTEIKEVEQLSAEYMSGPNAVQLFQEASLVIAPEPPSEEHPTPDDVLGSTPQEIAEGTSVPMSSVDSFSVGRSEPPPKFSSSQRDISTRFQGRRNISHIRRENELVQLIESSGGIVNTSVIEFIQSYMELVEAIVLAGEVASAPIGARIDRRTLNLSLDNLQSHGRVKLITTTIWSATGSSRIAKIAYLSTVGEEQLRSYLATLGGTIAPIPQRSKEVQPCVTKAPEDPNNPRVLATQWLYAEESALRFQERWSKNIERAQDLFTHGDDVIREALLLEKQTVSQMYGFLVGKLMRARHIHVHAAEVFERGSPPSCLVLPGERIIDRYYFETDVPLSVYCACLSSDVFDEEIRATLSTEAGRNMPVKDIPSRWRSALRVGKARSRERIFDLLEILRVLQIVTPLRDANSPLPLKFRPANLQQATSLIPMQPNWTTTVPLVHPQYWLFNSVAPVYLLASADLPVPFNKDMSITSKNGAIAYWEELRLSSLDKKHTEAVRSSALEISSFHGPCGYTQRVSTALKRLNSWRADYVLSWYQTQYLKRSVDFSTGSTPLEDADNGTNHLTKISYLISAPLEVVRRFYVAVRETHLQEVERARSLRDKKIPAEQRVQIKAMLIQKGAEAVVQRERAWNVMVEKVHPGLLKGVAAARLKRLQKSYVAGNSVHDNHHWEMQITEAIKTAEKVREARKLFPVVMQPNPPHILQRNSHVGPLPPGANDRSLDMVIQMQKDAFAGQEEQESMEVKPGRKKKNVVRAPKSLTKPRVRRHRFQWNADFDDLARDASAIIRARCRTHHRLDWGALEQVFPFVPRNTVRQRIGTLKDQPGAETYLQRLENSWHALWVKHRGTPQLPDDSPHSMTEFDLKIHLEFLRKNIDKNVIRVGLSGDNEEAAIILPVDPTEFMKSWRIVDRPTRLNWDCMFNYNIAEEAREKMFLEDTFSLEQEPLPKEDTLDSVSFAESALKMVIGTPNEEYDAEVAAKLLHGVGEKDIESAMDNLLSRNVLSKLVRDSRRLTPGRTLKISEMNQNALGGPIAKEIFQDAAQLEQSYTFAAAEEWREWPLVSTDGDTAALLQFTSDHKAEFNFDTSHSREARLLVDGNSKKADDDDIELAIHVRLHDIELSLKDLALPVTASPVQIEMSDGTGHGLATHGGNACCRLSSEGVVDCLKCIEQGEALVADWAEQDKRVAERITGLVESKGVGGLKIQELQLILKNDHDAGKVMGVLQRLHTVAVPLVYFTGYSSSFVVSAKFINAWTVSLPGMNLPVTRIFPRRWLDISAERITEVLESALRAVMGIVHMRPGISQAELRWRLRAVYDRQEVIDLLKHLSSNGRLEHSLDPGFRVIPPVHLEAATDQEERAIRWFARKSRHWYQIS